MNTNLVMFHGEIKNIFMVKNNHILLRVKADNNNVNFFITDPAIKRNFDFRIGDFVTIIGNVQSNKSVDGKKFHPTVFVTQIARPASPYPSFNQFFISGKVVKTIPGDHCKIIVVRTMQDARVSYVPVVFYQEDVILRSVTPGSFISASGRIQSVAKTIDCDTQKHYQNYVGNLSTLRKIS